MGAHTYPQERKKKTHVDAAMFLKATPRLRRILLPQNISFINRKFTKVNPILTNGRVSESLCFVCNKSLREGNHRGGRVRPA